MIIETVQKQKLHMLCVSVNELFTLSEEYSRQTSVCRRMWVNDTRVWCFHWSYLNFPEVKICSQNIVLCFYSQHKILLRLTSIQHISDEKGFLPHDCVYDAEQLLFYTFTTTRVSVSMFFPHGRREKKKQSGGRREAIITWMSWMSLFHDPPASVHFTFHKHKAY